MFWNFSTAEHKTRLLYRGRRPTETHLAYFVADKTDLKVRTTSAFYTCAGANYTRHDSAIYTYFPFQVSITPQQRSQPSYYHFQRINLHNAKVFGVIVHSLITDALMIHCILKTTFDPSVCRTPNSK